VNGTTITATKNLSAFEKVIAGYTGNGNEGFMIFLGADRASTFSCGPYEQAHLIYFNPTGQQAVYAGGTDGSCTITVTSYGAPGQTIVGSFSAVHGKNMVANGSFSVIRTKI
jgi:hypothetical protein